MSGKPFKQEWGPWRMIMPSYSSKPPSFGIRYLSPVSAGCVVIADGSILPGRYSNRDVTSSAHRASRWRIEALGERGDELLPLSVTRILDRSVPICVAK